MFVAFFHQIALYQRQFRKKKKEFEIKFEIAAPESYEKHWKNDSTHSRYYERAWLFFYSEKPNKLWSHNLW